MSQQPKGCGGAVKEQSFYMLLKLSWYKLKLHCYSFGMLHIIPMVTTKKESIEYTQKEMRKELKTFHHTHTHTHTHTQTKN